MTRIAASLFALAMAAPGCSDSSHSPSGETPVAAPAVASRDGEAASGFMWPRFPFDPQTRIEPVIAVFYATDDIGQDITLGKLGYPDRKLFRLHSDHPKLHVVMMSCPANRYLGEGTLDDSPEASATWKTLALDPGFDWIELGGHGYTHSPEDDSNLHHHEFSVTQTGCNVDHSRMADPAYCRERFSRAREAYRAAGIPDERVVVMRFPGVEDSPQALRAAAEAGFIAVLGSRHFERPGREWWIPHPGGGEILEIEHSPLLKLFARSEELEAGLTGGRIDPAGVTGSPEFVAAVERGIAYVERVVTDGGILSLSDHWWETFLEIEGVTPRYLILDALLREVDRRYGARAWYPGARDLALWLEVLRKAQVTWREEDDAVRVEIDPPARWSHSAVSGVDNASVLLRLPAGWRRASEVRIRQTPGRWSALDPSRYWMQSGSLAVVFPLRGRVSLHILGDPS